MFSRGYVISAKRVSENYFLRNLSEESPLFAHLHRIEMVDFFVLCCCSDQRTSEQGDRAPLAQGARTWALTGRRLFDFRRRTCNAELLVSLCLSKNRNQYCAQLESGNDITRATGAREKSQVIRPHVTHQLSIRRGDTRGIPYSRCQHRRNTPGAEGIRKSKPHHLPHLRPRRRTARLMRSEIAHYSEKQWAIFRSEPDCWSHCPRVQNVRHGSDM